MKIVVGIDPAHPSESLTQLLRRLDFAAAEAIYASYTPYPIVPPLGTGSAPDDVIQSILDAQRGTSVKAMQSAADDLGPVTPGDSMVFDFGEPSMRLEQLAKESLADLIAIGARPHTALEAAFLGSVGRGLTLHSKHSLLIARNESRGEGPLKAIFAYDGSDCSDRSLDLLARFHPQGLSEIELVIVDTPDLGGSPAAQLFGEGAFYQGEEHRHDVLLRVAQDAAKRLSDAGFKVQARCVHGKVRECIRELVIDLKADLVIMGAQGHGWVERVLLGSHALEQVVTEPHSVLLLRPWKVR